MNTKDNKLSIADFSVEKLAELSGKKEEQLKLVEENPFIEIIDTKTSDEANKRRTALRTGRTTLEKEQKDVITKIKQVITDPVKAEYEKLISITSPHEKKQQDEIDRYKAEKEAEKEAIAKAERERVQNIKNEISGFVHKNKVIIDNLKYEDSLSYELPVLEYDFQEFKSVYISEFEALKFLLKNKKEFLAKEEKNRLDAIEIKKQQDEAKRVQDIRESIWNYAQNWIKKINNATIETIKSVNDEFLNQEALNFAEFQKEFEFKRDELTTLIDQRTKQIEQQAEYEKQQAEMLEFKRRKEISELGFDFNTLIYQNAENRIQLDIKDILGTEQGFRNIFNHLKQQIESFNKPKQETTAPTPSEIPSQPTQEMQSPTNMTTFQSQPQAQVFSTKQTNAIKFISEFVSFTNGRSMTIDLIKEYGFSNVK